MRNSSVEGGGSRHFTVQLPHPAFDAELERLNARISKAHSVAELR